MAISPRDVIYAVIGFILVAILTPIGMGQIIVGYNTSWNAAVITIFSVVLPLLYVIGAALHFIPKIGGGD